MFNPPEAEEGDPFHSVLCKLTLALFLVNTIYFRSLRAFRVLFKMFAASSCTLILPE